MESVPNPFQADDDPEPGRFIDPDRITAYAPSAGASLDDRYRLLQAREAALLRRQQQLQDAPAAAPAARRPNWPPYVSFLYVDLNADIPRAARATVKAALVGVAVAIGQSVVNLIASFSATFGLSTHKYVRAIIMAVIFALVTCYLTIAICFPRLYKACKEHDVPFSFITWQFVLIGWTAYLCAGFPNSGSAGFATFIDLIAKSPSVWPTLIAGINTFALVASLVIQIVVMTGAQKYQKISGVPENMQPMVTPEVLNV
jgi:hypothetical protein